MTPASALGRRRFLGGLAAIFSQGCAAPARLAHSSPRVDHAVLPARFHELALPARDGNAPDGKAFLESTTHLTGGERELAIGREILAGNVPTFLRQLTRVVLPARSGLTESAAIWVTRDYLAIGSDQSFVRVPMAKRMAHRIARQLSCTLPTSHLVDAIYAASTCKISSPAHGPSSEMASSELYAAHNTEIEERRQAAHCSSEALVAGPKKDLVMSAREHEKPGHLAIYGWFHDDGTPIQPVSMLHSGLYVDFSHGVRLVSTEIEVDGRERSIYELLRDPRLAQLVSDEGPFEPVEN